MNFDQRRGGLAQNRNQTEGQRQGLRDKMEAVAIRTRLFR